MEQFLVKQVLGKDLKVGDTIWYNGSFTPLRKQWDVEEWAKVHPEKYFSIKLPSPDILIPSEEMVNDIASKKYPLPSDRHRERQRGFESGAEWYESRLKEDNKHLNFKIK